MGRSYAKGESMQTRIINELIVRINKEVREMKERLEVEEKGREIAAMQGKLGGFREFIGFLAAEYHLTQSMLEDTGDEPIEFKKIDEDWLANLALEIDLIQTEAAWQQVIERIKESTERIKEALLHNADGTRDLDIMQGRYRAIVFYTELFNSIRDEVEFRNRAKEKKLQEPDLPFDEEDDNIVEFPLAVE